MANSKLKKYSEIPNLYIDEATGIFYVRMYHKGTTRIKSLKTKNLVHAKQRIASAISSISTTDKRKSKNVLVGDYYESFLSAMDAGDLSDATKLTHSIAWRHHVEPFWANVPDNDVTQEKYDDFLIWHRKSKRRNLFNVVKMFSKYVGHMRSKGAPIGVLNVYLPKKEKNKLNEDHGEYLSESEFNRLKIKTLSDRVKVLLAYKMGMRIGEIVNLKQDRLHAEQGRIVIRLRPEDTKTRKAREIPLYKELSDDLKEVSKNNGSVYVFKSHRSPKKPTSKQVVERMWKAALKKAGITKRVRFHDLRHTAATNMAELDLDPIKCCSILGMSLRMFDKTYVKKHKLKTSSIADLIGRGGQ